MALRGTYLVRIVLVASLTGACGGDTGESSDGDDAGRSGSAGDGATEHQSGGAGSLVTAGSPSTGSPSAGGLSNGETSGSGGADSASGGSNSAATTGGTSVGGSRSSGGTASHSGGASPDTGGSGPMGAGGVPASGGSSSSGGAAAHSGGSADSGGSAPMGSGGTLVVAGAGGRVIEDLGGFGGELTNGGAAGREPGAPGSAGTAGGAVDAGGMGGSAGAPQLPEGMECMEASDCRLVRAGCDCVSVPLDEPGPNGNSGPCSFDACAEYGVSEADVTCLRGRCTVGYTCGFEGVICAPAPPECIEGQTPSSRDGCWGPCVPIEECAPSVWSSDGEPLLEGVWLIGWAGDLLHFSVLRFPPEIDTDFGGELEYLAEPTTLLGYSLGSVVPYIDYSGTGIWQSSERPRTYLIGPLPDYDGAFRDTALTFTSFSDANGQYGSTLAATIEVAGDVTTTIEGYWFPAETCNEDMTVCSF